MENKSQAAVFDRDPDMWGSHNPPEGLTPSLMNPLPRPEMLEVLYFGWSAPGGHGLRRPAPQYQDPNVSRASYASYASLSMTPWGTKLDGGLCPEKEFPDRFLDKHEYIKVHRLDGWTAVAFWDRSGDTRPGSNTVFLVRCQTAAVEDILKWSRIQWPEVWARPGFPIR